MKSYGGTDDILWFEAPIDSESFTGVVPSETMNVTITPINGSVVHIFDGKKIYTQTVKDWAIYIIEQQPFF